MKLEDLTKKGKVTLVITGMGAVVGAYVLYRTYVDRLIDDNYKEFQKFSDARLDPETLRNGGVL